MDSVFLLDYGRAKTVLRRMALCNLLNGKNFSVEEG